MRANSEFSICEVAGKSFLIPIGSQTIDVNKILDLNDTSLFIMNKLSEDCSFEQLLCFVLEEYDVDKNIASADLKEFIDKAIYMGVIVE